jgi:hypothetical protein
VCSHRPDRSYATFAKELESIPTAVDFVTELVHVGSYRRSCRFFQEVLEATGTDHAVVVRPQPIGCTHEVFFDDFSREVSSGAVRACEWSVCRMVGMKAVGLCRESVVETIEASAGLFKSDWSEDAVGIYLDWDQIGVGLLTIDTHDGWCCVSGLGRQVKWWRLCGSEVGCLRSVGR